MIETDVLIVGAGPAGSACAGRLQGGPLGCILLDRQPFPRPKPCAGWITPRVLRALNLEAEDYPHGLTRFTSFDISIKGIKFHLRTEQYAIRRLEFDQWLLQRAAVDFRVHTVQKIEQAGGRYIVDGAYSARWLVGAGGTHCPVRRALFDPASPPGEAGLIVAMEEEFRYQAPDDRCRLWFLEDGLPGYAWYVPKAGGWLNVGIGGSAAQLKSRGRPLKEHWGRLLEKLERQGLAGGRDWKPSGHSYFLRRAAGALRNGNALLAGDSIGLATLDMGEGIGPAIESGLRAAETMLNGTPYSIRGIPRYSFPSLLGLRR